MFEYDAQISLELTEEHFEDMMDREVRDEEDWKKFVDSMIDACYNFQEHLFQGLVPLEYKLKDEDDNPLHDDWKVV